MEDNHNPESETERAARIYGNWRKASFQPARNVIWEKWGFAAVHLFVLMCLGLNLSDLEYVFWGSDRLHWFFLMTLTGRFPAGLSGIGLALLPINYLLLENYLNLRTSQLGSVRKEVRWLRAFLSALPILGLYVVPCWKWLLKEHPEWIYRSLPIPGNNLLSVPGRYSIRSLWQRTLGSRLQSVQSSPLFIIWLGSLNMLAAKLAFSDLSASEWTTPARRMLICILLHLAGMFCTASLLISKAKRAPSYRWGSALSWLATAAWLLPHPLCFIALLAFHSGQWEASTMVDSAGDVSEARKDFRKHISGYWQKKPAWSRWWALLGLSRQQEPLAADYRFAAFCRKKTFLVLIDSVALALIWVDLALNFTLGPVFAVVMALCLLFSTFLGMHTAFRLMYRAFIRLIKLDGFLEGEAALDPSRSYMVLTQWAFLGGFLLGMALALGQLPRAVVIILLISFVYILGDLNSLINIGVEKWKSWKDRAFWLITFSSIGALAIGMAHSLEGLYAAIGVIYAAVAGVPLWAWILGRSAATTALHPITWHRALDKGTPLKDRRGMLLILLGAWLPLGGLTIPFWFEIRKNLEIREEDRP